VVAGSPLVRRALTLKNLLLSGLLLSLLALACSDSKTDATKGAGAPLVRAVSGEPPPGQPVVDDVKITILSDMMPGRHTAAEWGFSALVEVTAGPLTKRFLFDTGGAPQTVLSNAAKLNVDLCSIEDVVLSHNHGDHTLGLNTLRSSCTATNPHAFEKAYVGGDEVFWSRPHADGTDDNVMLQEKGIYEAHGGTFVVTPTAGNFLHPGVWLTGKIARTYDEKTYPGTPQIKDPSTGALASDTVPEEHALVINTNAGLVIVTGCAHAGIVNTVEQSVATVGGHPNVSLVGGLHLMARPLGDENTVATVRWVANKLKGLGVTQMLGSHCTGLERFAFLREYLGLPQTQAVFSTVGTVFSPQTGFVFTNPAINTPLQ
jgi:7,8-dihydropterin-6-yl-methyl-4-(beta-D-ribofuranosyl)aminobenzene 5'-phosphate synthase